jgi:hypothetical protein
MINVFGSLGRIGAVADLVEAQGGVQQLTSTASKALQTTLGVRDAVGPLSSKYSGSGGTSPAVDSSADTWDYDAVLPGSGSAYKQLQSLSGGAVALVTLADLQKALDGGTGPIRYYIVKNMDIAKWYATSGSTVAIIPPVVGAAAAAGTEEEKPMSTAGKVLVVAGALGVAALAVKAFGGGRSMGTADTVRSY